MHEILQLIKEEKDLQDVYNYLYKPMIVLEDIEKKFKSLNIKDKTREVNLDVPYKIDRIKNNYLPQIIHTYLNFDIHYRNTKVIQSVNDQNLTAKDVLLNQISKVLEEIELIEEIYYLNNQQQFLVNGVIVDKIGYEDNLLNNESKHIKLKNEFDYQAYEKEEIDKDLKTKTEAEKELEDKKILQKAKLIQDELDKKQFEKDEEQRVIREAEERKIEEAKKVLKEAEEKKQNEEKQRLAKLEKERKEKEANEPKVYINPQPASKKPKTTLVVGAGSVSALVVMGAFFFNPSSDINNDFHTQSYNQLNNISSVYDSINSKSLEGKQSIAQYVENKLSNQNNATVSFDAGNNTFTIGQGKSAEKIILSDEHEAFDPTKPKLKIRYQLPKTDGDTCFAIAKDLTDEMKNIDSITINDIELTKHNASTNGVLINNDKIFQACTDGTKEVDVYLKKAG
jgi:hypothetical protein